MEESAVDDREGSCECMNRMRLRPTPGYYPLRGAIVQAVAYGLLAAALFETPLLQSLIEAAGIGIVTFLTLYLTKRRKEGESGR